LLDGRSSIAFAVPCANTPVAAPAVTSKVAASPTRTPLHKTHPRIALPLEVLIHSP
jgi:hypothetical protein